MYYPSRFNRELSLQLGRLIEQAYEQFDAFETNREWCLPAEYRLIEEIKYASIGTGIIDEDNIIGNYILKLPFLKGRKIAQIPIGFIAQQGKEAFIIFRGTQTPTEWINNLNAKLAPFLVAGFGNVHDGFLGIYLNVRNQILEAVKEFKKVKEIYVAGHSLGASFAAFAACDIENSLGIRIEALYTYGSPRIGDNAFVTAFNSAFAQKSFRILNTSDMVTEVPFPTTFAGFLGAYFSHIDTPVVFTIQENDIEKNHHMATYVAALAQGKKSIIQKLSELFAQ